MSEFIFLYRGERNLKTMSPEEAQKSMTKWRAWFKDLSDSGHLKNLALAEDVVQDAFCRALETWKFHGVPKNPSAWLLTAAKNRALDVLRSERTVRKFAPELTRLLESEWTLAPVVDESFGPAAMKDVQLRMMFSCIHPRLPEEAQVALVLHLLCGFSVGETAAAFLKERAAMQKRIGRAKK